MGDRTKAEALRLAEKKLIALGWNFTPEDIGKTAALILKAMGDELES